MKRRHSGLLLTAGFVAVLVYAIWRTVVPPSGPVHVEPRPGGLPSACTVLRQSTVDDLVPDAAASGRELSRNSARCTLAGAGARELTVVLSQGFEHRRTSAAEHAVAMFGRELERLQKYQTDWLPALQRPPDLGDEAFVIYSVGGGAAARVVARRGLLVADVEYSLPPAPEPHRFTDPAEYAAARAGAERAVREILATLGA